MDAGTYTEQYLKETEQIVHSIDQKEIVKSIELLRRIKENGGRLFILGVGGSAANASHAVNDFRKIAGIEAYAPTDNVAELTARTNDEGWNTTFSKWLETSRINSNDALLIFSVGGGSYTTSLNIKEAIDYALERKAKIAAIVSREGGYARQKADACVLIPVVSTDRVTPHAEGWQGIIWHLIVNAIISICNGSHESEMDIKENETAVNNLQNTDKQNTWGDSPERIRKAFRALEKGKPRSLLRFVIRLCEHCNLNCKGCMSFSPLAEKQFLDPDIFERDCRRLSALSNGQAEKITLVGGELLLHPGLLEIQNIARRYFCKSAQLKVITNGLLLANQDEDFWFNCRDNAVIIEISGYPVTIDIEKIAAKAERFGVSVLLRELEWFKSPLDVEGTQDIHEMYNHCIDGNSCICLENGKMSTCEIPSKIRHFNRYFDLNLQVSDDDFIDIYKVKTLEELMQKLAHPIPFCRYCRNGFKISEKWEVSRKVITEWI
ncbi:hypothetical protein FACS1894151_03400 [Spirochaetia bacterium]|nr:hypothetical protein FACS1894151_03400 [Spirochaetia bacterium]